MIGIWFFNGALPQISPELVSLLTVEPIHVLKSSGSTSNGTCGAGLELLCRAPVQTSGCHCRLVNPSPPELYCSHWPAPLH